MGDLFIGGHALKFLERIAVALEARAVEPAQVDTLKALNAGQHAENARLRERVATLEKNTYLGLCPPEWPTPQPIETAPHGETRCASGGRVSRERDWPNHQRPGPIHVGCW